MEITKIPARIRGWIGKKVARITGPITAKLAFRIVRKRRLCLFMAAQLWLPVTLLLVVSSLPERSGSPPALTGSVKALQVLLLVLLTAETAHRSVRRWRKLRPRT